MLISGNANAEVENTSNVGDYDASISEVEREAGKEIDAIIEINSTEEPEMDYEGEIEETPTPEELDFRYDIDGVDDIAPNAFKVSLPECSDERLLDLVKSSVEAYNNRNPALSVIGARRQLLMLKHIDKLSPMSSDNLTSKDDYTLANEIITLKLNRGVSAINIKVCKGPNSSDNVSLYVIVYELDGSIIGKIINFANENPREKDLEFIY
jgi:hypothetical protein